VNAAVLLSLVSLLAGWSAHATLTRLQHRVRKPHRLVPYQHVLEENRRYSEYSRFWMPEEQQDWDSSSHGASSSTRHGARSSSRNSAVHQGDRIATVLTSDETPELLWMYLADASSQNGPAKSSTKSLTQRRRRDSEEELPLLSSWSKRVRRLFDQFVGEDTQTYLEAAANDTTVDNFGTNETGQQSLNNETYAWNETYTWNVTTNVSYDINTSVVYTTPGEELEQKTPQFQPLRIRAILSESSGNGGALSIEERDALFHDILGPALLTWSTSLRVDPVVGNLTVDVNQLYDGETCGPGVDSGLPSVKVPLEHLTVGIPDTDMIVYLSVGFVLGGGGANFSRSNSTTNSSLAWNTSKEEKTAYSSSSMNIETRLNSQFAGASSSSNGTGLVNATNATHPKLPNGCAGQYLAAASFCSTDQYDRPTAALLHICIDDVFFEPSNLNRNILLVMHELGHALGFNSLSMAHFRRPDGTPITNRVDGDIPDSEVQCTGPSAERRSAKVALPSEEILQFRSVRGGVRVAELVTPSVLQVVRNQFDCQELLGAELESGESLPLSSDQEEFACIGDHWERRLFSSDLMNPIVDDIGFTARVSTLTLAYFADSGWYQVDLSRADVAAGWGRGAGCGFVNDTCIGKDGQVPPQNAPFFCNDVPTNEEEGAGAIHGCTPDLSRKAVCSIGHYDLDLPSEYQYFLQTYGSDVGGADPFMDYCPVYLGFSNGLCSSSDNIALKASPLERFGERNSRCLLSKFETHETALCLPIACVVEDRSLRIKIDGAWKVCEYPDQRLNVAGDTQHVILCPDPRRVCPTFYCPYDCLGTGGACDYLTGKCMCEVQNGYSFLTNKGNSSMMQVCGENGTETLDIILNGPFLRPVYEEKEDSYPPRMPDPDSPLSDYYVPTTQSLRDDRSSGLDPWQIALACMGGIVLAVVVAAAVLRLSGRPVHLLWRSWNRQPSNDGHDGVMNVNREKDKMIATVLVEMRRQGRNGRSNAVAESLAETDCRLTMSDASCGEARSESRSALSSCPPSDALSDGDHLQDDSIINEDHLPICPQTLIRRRVVQEIIPAEFEVSKSPFSIG
jgi:Leishmanolysin